VAGKQIHLSAFLNGSGHHLAAWLHPDVDPARAVTFEHYRQCVLLAEAAKFDAVFFADNLALPLAPPELLARASIANFFEPPGLLFALAPLTSRIGLIATVSSTYEPPFHVARKFASLDHISGGRAGWNLVTSATDAEARNFGLKEQIAHKERYERAAEYVAVVKGLWQSWDEDPFLFDKQGHRFFDSAKLHVLDHEGPHYTVRGPLSLPPSPQGQPLIVQAGSSEDGQALAAATADMVFTAQNTLAGALAFASGVRDRMATAGRPLQSVRIMPGLQPFVGRTLGEAHAKFERLQALIDPVQGLGLLYAMTGIRFSPDQLDEPVKELAQNEGMQSRIKLFAEIGRGLTLRGLMQKVAGSRGHFTAIGTPGDIADQIEEWVDKGAADGFNIMAPILPEGLRDFADHVVPELQRRGRFRTDYAGSTLRGHLGLPKPSRS
jgi:N-acetyl-S-(2-succino)cysteine monooxygenase